MRICLAIEEHSASTHVLPYGPGGVGTSTFLEEVTERFFFSLMRHLMVRRELPPTETVWRLRKLPTGHAAMIMMPRAMTEGLLEVV
jgi:hypothetical protein